MQIFIAKLVRKDITTKDGRNTAKYTIITDEGKYYDSWCDDWNKTWKEGMVLDIQETQLDSREFNGKIYITIKAPGSKASANTIALTAIKELSDQFKLMNELQKDTNKMLKTVFDYVQGRTSAK